MDIGTFAFIGSYKPIEENNGRFFVVVTANTIYVMEMIVPDIAFNIYMKLGGQDAIDKVHDSAMKSIEGTFQERVAHATKETLKLFEGAIKYYEIKGK